MSEKVNELVKAVLELSREDQADFLDTYQIARSRAENGFPFDESWLEEIDRRTAEWERGEVQSLPGDEVEQRLRKRISEGG